MQIEPTPLPGVLILTPVRHRDARGFFAETWNRQTLKNAGLETDFVQDNHSLSYRRGTLRGLHYQLPPFEQAKLVRCARGRLLDVAVDIRPASPTFRQWVAVELGFDNGRQLFIPAGFAHGFLTLEDDTEIAYKCSAPYSPAHDRAIRFDDPDIGIDWPLAAPPILSDKDAAAPPLAHADLPPAPETAP